MQEVGVVALLRGWDAVAREPAVIPGRLLGTSRASASLVWVQSGAPALIAEGYIGGDVVEGLQRVAILEERVGEGVALLDLRRGVVVQDHVHAGEAGG